MAVIEFDSEERYMKAIDIVDIGNTVIRATSEDVCDYYILIKTVMGKTSILTFGPVIPDVPMLVNGFNVNYKKMDYKEPKIIKEINSILNNAKTKIIDAKEILQEEIEFPEILNLYNNC